VSEYVEMEMQVNDHKERITLTVTGLGKEDIFLGHEWLQYHNPSIDWKQKHLYFDCCLRHCNTRFYDDIVEPEEELEPEPIDGEETIDEGKRLLMIDMSQALDVRAHYTPSQEMAVEEERKRKREKTVEEDLLTYLQDYHDVFDKKEFDELPPSRPWDHAIELIEGADTTFKVSFMDSLMKNTPNSMNFSKRTFVLVGFAYRVPQWLPPSSSSRKRTEGSAQFRITAD
jgi:hypothetical protein